MRVSCIVIELIFRHYLSSAFFRIQTVSVAVMHIRQAIIYAFTLIIAIGANDIAFKTAHKNKMQMLKMAVSVCVCVYNDRSK